MAANSSGQGFQNKNRVAILAELDKEKRKLLMQNQSSTNHPGARPSLNKDFRDHAEQQHIAAQQKAALQDCTLLHGQKQHCVECLAENELPISWGHCRAQNLYGTADTDGKQQELK
ncbi:SOSS complex subunit C isoform X2 [Fukomys damarensis]|uniref:SOSS complex subunit C isoform X2 n=1 Tax=Fukomys damarensis TaxID=885580 RepID=UPI001455C9D4|nr:SOSS complex subunit C isoform X2 [Fukomys damarensis]